MSRQDGVVKSGPRWPQVRPRRVALALLAAASSSWAGVSARLDHSNVAPGQPLTLTLVSDGKSSGAQPDLAPLRKDFEVLGTRQSRETRIVNLQRADQVRWIVQLLPRHAGHIEVPALSIGAEQTAALQLEVAEPTATAKAGSSGQGAERTVFIEVDSAAAGKPVYVQQQVPYTVRVYVDPSVQSGELSAPSSPDAVIEQLGADQRSTATVRGRDYSVIERHYAISAEKSGTLQIAPASFRGTALVAQADAAGDTSDGDPGDDIMRKLLRNSPFANDPMFRNGLLGGLSRAAATTPVGASGQPMTLAVRPRPAAAQGQWLPAEQIQLQDSWAGGVPAFKAGEPVTRTLTVQAKGLAASQIPPLALAQPANARLYADAPDNQSRTDGTTIYGISKQTVTYLPTAAGTLDVAPVDLAWWDTRDNLQRHAELPAQHFQVEQGAGAVSAGATPAASSATTAAAAAVATASEAVPVSWPLRISESLRKQGRPLAWSGLVLLLAGALAGWALLRRRGRGLAGPIPALAAAPVPGRRSSLKALRHACVAGDRYKATQSLLDLARVEWPEHVPRGLGELAQRLDAGADEVRALDRSLYGAALGAWDGKALWQAVGNGLHPGRHARPDRRSDDLAPLYP